MLDIPTTIALAASTAAAASDLWCYRIPNMLTFPILLSGFGYGLLDSGGWGLAASLGGAAVGFAALFGLYLAGGMGAGDVKLMAGLGAWLGPSMISQVVLASCAAGGLYALALWGGSRWRGDERPRGRGRFRLRRPGSELAQLAHSPTRRRQLIPYGLVILVGLIVSLARAHVFSLA